MAEYFLGLAARDGAPKRLTAAAASRLLAYPWPGNVREIKNVIERANVLVRGHVIDADDLELNRTERTDSDSVPAQWLNADLPTAIAKLERAMIVHALDSCGGNRAEVARRLNINRQLLYTKMQRYRVAENTASEDPTQAVGKADADKTTR
jgi:DNA-binding NtrC family response regulator